MRNRVEGLTAGKRCGSRMDARMAGNTPCPAKQNAMQPNATGMVPQLTSAVVAPGTNDFDRNVYTTCRSERLRRQMLPPDALSCLHGPICGRACGCASWRLPVLWRMRTKLWCPWAVKHGGGMGVLSAQGGSGRGGTFAAGLMHNDEWESEQSNLSLTKKFKRSHRGGDGQGAGNAGKAQVGQRLDVRQPHGGDHDQRRRQHVKGRVPPVVRLQQVVQVVAWGGRVC